MESCYADLLKREKEEEAYMLTQEYKEEMAKAYLRDRLEDWDGFEFLRNIIGEVIEEYDIDMSDWLNEEVSERI